jgi:hypothetical protein
MVPSHPPCTGIDTHAIDLVAVGIARFFVGDETSSGGEEAAEGVFGVDAGLQSPSLVVLGLTPVHASDAV